MSNKRFDFSVLPDGFLIEWAHGDARKEIEDRYLGSSIRFARLSESLRQLKGWRPALNHWHFNDGSMVLPDGLVVEEFQSDGIVIDRLSMFSDLTHQTTFEGELLCDCVLAIQIIGAHPDYAEHAKELGMPVVEL